MRQKFIFNTEHYDMIKKKGSIEIHNGEARLNELLDSVETLKDGKYSFIIFNEAKKNPALPQLKYLFGVVLSTISEKLPNHPPVEALYRYFESIYAPLHTCEIGGDVFEYVNLKNEKAVEVDNVIADIIHHATSQWGIQIVDSDVIRTPEAQEAYEDAYIEMWKKTLNTNNIIHTNE